MTSAVAPIKQQHDVFHATTVSIDGKGVFIVGSSGAGKSALALELMGMGAVLVADDRTIVQRKGAKLWASVPVAIQGKIEARGVGILNVTHARPTDLAVVIDLSKTSECRLPEPQFYTVLGINLDCLHHVSAAYFAASILFYVKGIVDRES